MIHYALRIILATVIWFAWLLSEPARSDEDNCRGFIPTSCCCSNKCCDEITSADVFPIPGEGNRFQIKASGEIITAKWSQDGRYYRCHCDYDPERGWVKHPQAKTHCLFVPPPSS